jgi:hypothetical protein
MIVSSSVSAIFALTASLSFQTTQSLSIRPQSSYFHGRNVVLESRGVSSSSRSANIDGGNAIITMRKQKASNRRTRRQQRGGKDLIDELSSSSSIATASSLMTPIATDSWNHKSISSSPVDIQAVRGRGRSRKRSQYYNSLSSYHSHFLKLITAEFLAEVRSYCM